MSLDKIVVRTRYVDLLLDALGTDLFTFAPRKNSLTAFEGDSSMKDILLLESLGFLERSAESRQLGEWSLFCRDKGGGAAFEDSCR